MPNPPPVNSFFKKKKKEKSHFLGCDKAGEADGKQTH